MKKYHVATGDGKAYYGVNYESYREAKGVLEFSQKRDPQAHIVEEEYHFTNSDRIRAMSDEELANWLGVYMDCILCPVGVDCIRGKSCEALLCEWLKQPADQ